MIIAMVIMAFAVAPSQATEDSWVFAGGEVVGVEDDSFIVDTLEGKLHVQLDSWNWFRLDRDELDGKEVHVVGQVEIDNGKAILKPMGITLNEWNTHHHLAGFDQASIVQATRRVAETELLICGTVTQADGDELMLNAGKRILRINTRDLVENIVDDNGYQQVKAGSRILVAAPLDRSFIEEGRVEAQRVISLVDNLES